MIRITTLFALLAIATTLSSQQTFNGGCGTEVTPEFRTQYASRDRSDYDMLANQRAGMRYIPVYYHMIAKSDGTGAGPLVDVFDSHCELNADYNQFDIYFYVAGIDTIKNTTLWNYQSSNLGWQAFSQYNESNVCNIYVNGNLPGLCGFATFPGSGGSAKGGIFLNKSCVGAGTKTLPHEMGHYLGLMHTFDDNYGVEFVNGSNCSSAGDLFCDTPADFLADRTPCPYNGNEQDPNGDFYNTVIDETLFMSYFSDNCVNRFSPMQQVEMNNVITQDRPYLLNHPLPNVSAVDSPTFVLPIPNSSPAANFVTFQWTPVANAVYYRLTVQSATGATIYADTIVTTTNVTVTNLLVNKTYKYRVKGFSYGNTCGQNTLYHTIKTGGLKAEVSSVTPTCANGNDGTITVTPLSGSAPYTYEWSNGQTGITANTLGAGTYTVTITDANGQSVVVDYTLSPPAPIQVNINQVSGVSLNANVSGGTPPYNYAWSNGVNLPLNTSVGVGTYTVTVTDSRGCSSSQTFAYSAIGDEPSAKIGMKLYPNPASQSTTLFVQLDLAERMDAAIQLLNSNGQLVQEMNRELFAGTNKVVFNTSTLSSGIYVVRFVSEKGVATQRVVIN